MTNGRYSSRNETTEKVNIAKIEEDTELSFDAVAAAIEVIDESIRTLPDSIEVLAARGDKDGIKKLIALAGSANDDSETYKQQLSKLRERQKQNIDTRPTKQRHFADHYSRCFNVGAEALALSQRIGSESGGLVDQIHQLIEPEAAQSAEEEVKS